MHEWLATPAGQYLLGWEQAQMNMAVADVFGFHALQLGLPELDALQANRMPHRWLASQTVTDLLLPGVVAGQRAALVTDFAALPFPANSLDLVLLPHALELNPHPHGVLREVERVLVPEGRVIICGFNPVSLWGFRHRRARWYRQLGIDCQFFPPPGAFIGYLRLRSWLGQLNLEIEERHFGIYRPAWSSQAGLQRLGWLDGLGTRCWPLLGAAYFLVAVKRVRGMTLLNPAWKPARWLARAPVSIANSAGPTRAAGQNDI